MIPHSLSLQSNGRMPEAEQADHNPKRKCGIVFWLFGGVPTNPSLTRRVVIVDNLQSRCLSFELR